jgi:hypothetical protein
MAKARLVMLRHTRTEIYSLSMSDGKRTLLFSDDGMNFEILPVGVLDHPVVAGDKAYLRGVEQEWRGQPNPGVYETPPGIYEFNLDSSRKFRRVLEMKPNMGLPVLNAVGTKALFLREDEGRDVYSIYETATWRLLHEGDLRRSLQAHCPDCIPGASGWLADSSKLFVNLVMTGGDGESDDAQNAPGAYLFAEDGTNLGEIPGNAGQLHLVDYVREDSIVPTLIGQLADGNYLFRDYARLKGPLPKAPLEMSAFLVLTSPNFKAQQQIPLPRSRLGQFQLSPKGNYLVFVEDRMTVNYQTVRHLWMKNLQSGEEKEISAAPSPAPSSPGPSPISAFLGWLQE